jgi:hypothetical protein
MMTHQTPREVPQAPPTGPGPDQIPPHGGTLEALLARGKACPDESGSGWLVGLAPQPEAGDAFATILGRLPKTGLQAFVLSAWASERKAVLPVLLAGPITRASFRAAVPLGSPGWGWFSVPFLQRRGAQAEAWLGVPFLSGRLIPFPSESAPRGAGSPSGATGCLGQPADAALERP